MPKKALKKARISASISKEKKELLEKIAKQSDISFSRLIQQAVTEFIANHPNGKLTLSDGLQSKE